MFHRNKISTLHVMYITLFIVCVLVLVNFVSYYYSYNNMRTRSISDTQVILDQIGKNIGRYISNIESISEMLNENEALLQYLSDDYTDEQEKQELVSGFSSFLDYVPRLADGIVSIFIFDAQNELVYKPAGLEMKPNYDFTQDLWYRKIAGQSINDPQLTGTQVRMMTQRDNPWVISVSNRIVRDGQVVGTQLIELNYQVIDEFLSDINLGAHGYVFIVEENGNIVYHPQLQLIYTELKQEHLDAVVQAESPVLEFPDENKLYTITTVPDTDFIIVGVMLLDEIVGTYREMLTIYITMALLLALVAFVGAVQMTNIVTKPLSQLEDAVKEVQCGNLDADFNIEGTQETEMFAQSLSSMIGEIKELMGQVVKDQELIRNSELKALQSQINPHFLYNTLDSIVWMAEENGDKEEIKKITMALANYFKIVLSSGQDIIPVRNEVEHIRNYLVIQKMRYEEMLEYEIDVADDALGCFMPKLLLQPLVENAIYHGIKSREGGGKIWIHGSLQDGKLVFQIIDNGQGMQPYELEDIFDPNRKTSGKHSGIALHNIRERIELHYGAGYGLNVQSEFMKGTQAVLTLPIIREGG